MADELVERITHPPVELSVEQGAVDAAVVLDVAIASFEQGLCDAVRPGRSRRS